MKLRICCANSFVNCLEKLEEKWHLQRTPLTTHPCESKSLSRDTREYFEYWIELNTLEELFELQKDLYVEDKAFNNYIILYKWEIWDRRKYGEYKKLEEDFGLKIYNDYLE